MFLEEFQNYDVKILLVSIIFSNPIYIYIYREREREGRIEREGGKNNNSHKCL